MDDTSPPSALHHHHVTQVNNFQNAQEGIWPHGPVQLTRGRQAKDPNAKTFTYNVASLDEFESALREYLTNPPENPGLAECQLSFWIGASFLVPALDSNHRQQQQQQQSQPPPPQQQQQQQQQQPPQQQTHPQAPPGYQPANGLHPQYGASANASNAYQPSRQHVSISDPAIALTLPAYPPPSSANDNSNNNENKTSLSILEALAPTVDPKEKMRKQRSIAKCCVDAIQRTDGFRYSFHNCWNSREDDSYRFSYYCNDSLLNKDRAANGKGAKFGKRATKPVYDCKGVLAVKFSATKQSLDVIYKHVPIHKTYEERAPPPRKDSKRRKMLEETDPEALIRIANRPKPPKPLEGEADPNAPPKPKRKRTKRPDESQKQTAANSIESDLRAQSLRSLLELIQTDEPAVDPVPEQAQKEVEEPPVALASGSTAASAATQSPTQARQRRPRNSCDICKIKKTKCDGTRPICQTCRDKKRQCYYADGIIDGPHQPQMNSQQPVQIEQDPQPPPPVQQINNQQSELEELRKQLEAAHSQIAALKAEKSQIIAKSVTPPQQHQQLQQPQQRTQPAPQVQPQHRPQPPPIQTAIQTTQPPPPQIQQTPQYAQFNQIANISSYGVSTRPSIQSPNPPPPVQATQQQQEQARASLGHLGQPQAPGSLNSNPDPAADPYGRDHRWTNNAWYQSPAALQYPGLHHQAGSQEPWGRGGSSGGYR